MTIITRILTLCVLVLALSAPSAFAQKRTADDEKVIFAFLKLSGEEAPDFTDWIKQGRLYQRTDSLLKPDVLEAEKARLQKAYAGYNAKQTPLRIEAEAKLSTTSYPPNAQILSFQFVDERSLELPYFPYDYGAQKIAFIIDDLKNHTQAVLNDEQTAIIKKHFLEGAPYIGTIDMILRPLSADSSAALPIDDQERFLLIGDIAHLEFRYYDEHEKTDLVLWEYTADWYKTPSTEAPQ